MHLDSNLTLGKDSNRRFIEVDSSCGMREILLQHTQASRIRRQALSQLYKGNPEALDVRLH